MLKKAACFIICSMLACPPGRAFANPAGESVAAGSVIFDRSSPNILNITTGPEKSIINWDSFSIAAHEAVNFHNLNAPSLNRVTGPDMSNIFGTLTAAGPIFLVNPNGIVFGAGSRVDVPALVASTLNITDNDFLHPQFNEQTRKYEYKFTKVDGKDAYIINSGRIITNGGYVCLLSQAVHNQAQGVIIAELGTVAMAAGEKMTLSLDDYNQVSVVIDESVQRDILGLGSAVTNSGSIMADGGRIILTAGILNKIFDYAVNNEGTIQANDLIERGGIVELISNGAIRSFGLLKAAMLIERGESFMLGGVTYVDRSCVENFDNAVNISGGFGGSLTDSGDIVVTGDLTLIADATFRAGGKFIVNNGVTVNGAYSLTEIGAAVFGGDVGTSGELSRLTIYGAAEINTGFIKTSGAQKYDGAVTLGVDTELTGSTVTFQNKIDGAHEMTVNGAAKFYGNVGSSVKLTGLAVNGPAKLYASSIATSGLQHYNGAVELLGNNTTMTGSIVTLDSTVNGNYGLTVSGSAIFNGQAGNGSLGLASLSVNGTTDIKSSVIKTRGSQRYSGAVTIGMDTALTGTGITFDSTVDGPHKLTLAAGSGDLAFNGQTGSFSPLESLRINSARGLTFKAAVSTTGDIIQTTGSGTTTFDNSRLSAGGNIDMESAAIAFLGDGRLTANNGNGEVGLTALAGGISSGGSTWDIVANKLMFSAAESAGSELDPIGTRIDQITSGVSSGGGIYIGEYDGFTINTLTAADDVWLSAGGATLLDNITGDKAIRVAVNDGDVTLGGTITAQNEIVVEVENGDVTFSGTLISTGSGAEVNVTNGSIYASGAGAHLDTADNIYLSVPQGTIAASGDRLNVSIGNGKSLILDIGAAVGLESGYLTSSTLSADRVLFLPSTLPSPLYPPGNVYFNGVRLWPSENAYLNSQSNSSLFSNRYNIPVNFSQFLINAFDTRLALFYQPLTESTMEAFDALTVSADAYEFINGSLNLVGHDGLLPLFDRTKDKKGVLLPQV